MRRIARSFMHRVARLLNTLSHGKLSPNSVTMVGLLAHVPIAYLIAIESNIWAAVLLVVFGLFDTLDGELARLQKSDSASGMLLDAVTDRMKETILYTGAAYALVNSDQPALAMWAVAACGFSLCVSYVKAKGETAIVGSGISANQANKFFSDGLLRFEVRMALLVAGLLFGVLAEVLIVIAVLSAFTAFDRLIKTSRYLESHK